MRTQCTIHSDTGFYIGDICYVLDDKVYSEWLRHGFDKSRGYFDVPDRGFGFAVDYTREGDGCYRDSSGRYYGVDAGVIGVVPLELAARKMNLDLGNVFYCTGDCRFESSDGNFRIKLPDGEFIRIAT